MPPEIKFYRQQANEDKTEINASEYYAAAERGGLRLDRPLNFRIGDVNWSYAYYVPPVTEEEVAEARERWEARDKNALPKLLLDEGDPLPDGMSEDQVVRREKADMTIHLPDGASWPITSWTWEGQKFPEGPPPSERIEFTKMEYTIPMSVELYEEFADSGKAIMEYLLNPTPKPVGVSPVKYAQTRRARIKSWFFFRRTALADLAYRVLSGEDIQDRIQRKVDDYF